MPNNHPMPLAKALERVARMVDGADVRYANGVPYVMSGWFSPADIFALRTLLTEVQRLQRQLADAQRVISLEQHCVPSRLSDAELDQAIDAVARAVRQQEQP